MSNKKVYQDVKEFTVKRSNWYRGLGSENSRLLNSEGKMCCLGFYSLACGFKKQEIDDIESPLNILENYTSKDWKTCLLNRSSIAPVNTFLSMELMKINDQYFTSDKIREDEITRLFKQVGIKVNFED